MAELTEPEKQTLDQEALRKQQEDEAAKKAAEEARAKELEAIPEPLRGKSQKELVDLLLNTNLELERLRSELETKKQETRPAEAMTEADIKALEEREFLSDPIAYLKKHTESRLRPLAEGYFEQQAEIQIQLAKSRKDEYPEFSKYEKQIRDTLTKMPADLRANPQAIDLAYKLAEYPELKKRYLEVSARSGLHSESSSSPPPTAKKIELSDEQRIVAKRFGLTDEQYIEWSSKRGLD